VRRFPALEGVVGRSCGVELNTEPGRCRKWKAVAIERRHDREEVGGYAAANRCWYSNWAKFGMAAARWIVAAVVTGPNGLCCMTSI
jgi:hypothetical protein